LLTSQIKLSPTWQDAFELFLEYSDCFNAINTTALIHHIACLEGTGCGGTHSNLVGGQSTPANAQLDRNWQAAAPPSQSSSTATLAPPSSDRFDLHTAVAELRELAEEELHK
jgi:hypothetical protein